MLVFTQSELSNIIVVDKNNNENKLKNKFIYDIEDFNQVIKLQKKLPVHVRAGRGSPFWGVEKSVKSPKQSGEYYVEWKLTKLEKLYNFIMLFLLKCSVPILLIGMFIFTYEYFNGNAGNFDLLKSLLLYTLTGATITLMTLNSIFIINREQWVEKFSVSEPTLKRIGDIEKKGV